MKIINELFVIVITIMAITYFAPPQIKVFAASDNYLNIQKVTVEQGLSNNHINSILEDHYGYIWFGTLSGLNKYDGMKFDIYYNDSSVVNSISNSDIQVIYESSSYNLWIGTAKGLNIFNRETNTFKAYLHDDNNPQSISNNRINTIYEDSSGILWIGTKEGLNKYNQATDNFQVYLNNTEDKDSISSNNITSIIEDSTGTLWIGTTAGLNVFNKETNSFTIYLNDDNDPYSISNNRINTIYEDSSGILWVGTAEGLNIFHKEENRFSVYLNDSDNPQSISSDFITSFCEDNDNNLWIGTRAGLNKVINKEGVFFTYKNEVDNQNSISNNRIVTLYKDIQGILWVGTINGINKIDLSNNAFNYYTGILGNNNILNISSIDNKSIWLELWGGITKFDIESKSVINMWSNILYDQIFYSSMSNTSCITADGCFWVGTGYSGLLRFDPLTNLLENYKNEPGDDNSLLNDSISSIYASSNNTLWIGTNEGLCSFNIETEEFLRYQNNTFYADALKNSKITVIYEDCVNNIWFGTNLGVYVLNSNTNEIYCVMNSKEFYGDSSDRSIYTIYEDSGGAIWIGTGYGLYCYTQNDGIMSFNHSGFQDEVILCIVEDNYGDLWIATRQHGLMKLSVKDNNYISYGVKDGLRDNFFSVGACYKTKDGELFFGCAGGLMSFYPKDIMEDHTAPTIVINGFNLIGGSIFFKKSVEDIKEIELSYFENSFEIDFVAFNYKAPEYNQYAYKLENFDKDWNYCSASESFTKYTNIPSGKYTFRVIASNSDGIWNNEGASLEIIITPPFWQKWWFILTLVAVALMLVIIAIKLRTYTLNKYAQTLEIQAEERTVELTQKNKHIEEQLNNKMRYTRALVHELKTPLTPLLASSDFLCSELEDKISLRFAKNINEGALNLSKRIDELLDLAKSETGMIDVNPQPVDLKYIVKNIIDHIKPEITKKNLNFNSLIPHSIPIINADEERLRQVILNLLDNAIKYTQIDGHIALKIFEKDAGVVIQIKDTGIGIDEKEMEYLFEPYSRLENGLIRTGGMGLGLFISKTIIELHGGRISVKSQRGIGSSFNVWLPIDYME